MEFDGVRQPNTLYIANVSRGKDSTAMLEAIKLLEWPLDMIVAIDIWATDTVPAELPPMVAFKDEWDRKCLERYGMPVTRICARNKDGSKKTYENQFYRHVSPERERERERERAAGRENKGNYKLLGFPLVKGPNGAWCQNKLKRFASKAFLSGLARGAIPSSNEEQSYPPCRRQKGRKRS